MKPEPEKTVTIALSPEQATRLRRAVETGAYASDGDVLLDALQLWELREELRTAETVRLKQAYEEGLASGGSRRVDAETFLSELKAEAGRRG